MRLSKVGALNSREGGYNSFAQTHIFETVIEDKNTRWWHCINTFNCWCRLFHFHVDVFAHKQKKGRLFKRAWSSLYGKKYFFFVIYN